MKISLEKKAAIKKLLKVTNIIQSAETTLSLFVNQTIEILKEPGDIIDPGPFNLMKKEAKALIHEEIVVKESFHLLMYPLYHKYLTLEEINELIKFYETPLGQKVISTNPKIMQESIKVGQIWGQELSLKLQERMSKILEKED